MAENRADSRATRQVTTRRLLAKGFEPEPPRWVSALGKLFLIVPLANVVWAWQSAGWFTIFGPIIIGTIVSLAISVVGYLMQPRRHQPFYVIVVVGCTVVCFALFVGFPIYDT